MAFATLTSSAVREASGPRYAPPHPPVLHHSFVACNGCWPVLRGRHLDHSNMRCCGSSRWIVPDPPSVFNAVAQIIVGCQRGGPSSTIHPPCLELLLRACCATLKVYECASSRAVRGTTCRRYSALLPLLATLYGALLYLQTAQCSFPSFSSPFRVTNQVSFATKSL
jgi:hypothetical protein